MGALDTPQRVWLGLSRLAATEAFPGEAVLGVGPSRMGRSSPAEPRLGELPAHGRALAAEAERAEARTRVVGRNHAYGLWESPRAAVPWRWAGEGKRKSLRVGIGE